METPETQIQRVSNEVKRVTPTPAARCGDGAPDEHRHPLKDRAGGREADVVSGGIGCLAKLASHV